MGWCGGLCASASPDEGKGSPAVETSDPVRVVGGSDPVRVMGGNDPVRVGFGLSSEDPPPEENSGSSVSTVRLDISISSSAEAVQRSATRFGGRSFANLLRVALLHLFHCERAKATFSASLSSKV